MVLPAGMASIPQAGAPVMVASPSASLAAAMQVQGFFLFFAYWRISANFLPILVFWNN